MAEPAAAGADDGLRDPSRLLFQTDRTRRSILLSYWTVFFLALPIWWYMTSIQRLSLPSSRVVDQAEKGLLFPIHLEIDTPDAVHIAKEIQTQLVKRSLLAPPRWTGMHISAHPKQNTRTNEISRHRYAENSRDSSGVYSISPRPGEPTLNRRTLHFPFEDGNAISRLVDILSALLVPYSENPDQEHRVAQYAPRYRLAFTLLNEDASAGQAVIGWDISSAVSDYVSPITNSVSVLHNFTIESQVQFHAPLAFTPHSISEDSYGLTPEDLTVFINSAEWTLSSGVSNDLVLHFVLFVPSASRRPLYILDANNVPSHSNAFILPQWGGIVIYNPPPEASSEEFLSLRHLDPIFYSFSEQLLALLGVPKLPDGVRSAETSTSSPILTDWQLDALLRWRTLKNVKGSQDTLLSIVKLVEQIGNMPVGKFVKDDVQEALAALDKVYVLSSTSLNQALHYSSRAITLASRAFFNPGMLALLYFPAEHKYAVYTPLFASAIIPLLGAALRELVAWRRTWREQRDRARRGTANR